MKEFCMVTALQLWPSVQDIVQEYSFIKLGFVVIN